jgi:hypothetical protein
VASWPIERQRDSELDRLVADRGDGAIKILRDGGHGHVTAS